MEQLKKQFVKEAQGKLEDLKSSIEAKQKVILQALESLYHITFDSSRGLIVDQIDTSLMNSSLMNASQASLDDAPDHLKSLKARNRREIESLEN